MSFSHKHAGVPCQVDGCALPADQVETSQITREEARAHYEGLVKQLEEEGIEVPPAGSIALSDQYGIMRAGSAATSVLARMKEDSLRKEATEAAETLLRMTTRLDVASAHGKDTPGRFVDMLKELTTPQPIKWTTFPADGMDEMISVTKITFTSVCEHHVIPFIGVAHVGYIPNELLPGLSKVARVVRYFAAGLQVQERLTQQVADYLDDQLKPAGLIVVMDAEHFCMTIRGVQAPGAKTRTTAVKGRFKEHDKTAKAEFMAGLNGH